MNRDRDALLPCPFCQGAAGVVERENPMSKWRWSVDCTSTQCGMSGPVTANKPDAIAAWNVRALPVGSGAEEACAVREAYREGWYVNAAVEDQPAEYLAGCEDVDWRESKAALSPRSADGLLRLPAKDGAAAPPQAPVAGSEDSADGWRTLETAAYETLAMGDRWLDPVLVRLADGTVTLARMSADEWLVPQGNGTFADLCAEPVAWRPISEATTTAPASKTGASRASEGREQASSSKPREES